MKITKLTYGCTERLFNLFKITQLRYVDVQRIYTTCVSSHKQMWKQRGSATCLRSHRSDTEAQRG